jgi:hypothetical protein
VSPVIAPLYFVVFVLLAQFVLVNVVVAVLMKHLEESHKHMEEDEDFEIDMEIARELAAEKRALQEAADRQRLKLMLAPKSTHQPTLNKVSSLPANFQFGKQMELIADLDPNSRMLTYHVQQCPSPTTSGPRPFNSPTQPPHI